MMRVYMQKQVQKERKGEVVRDLVKFGFIPSFYIFYYFSTSASFSILLISP